MKSGQRISGDQTRDTKFAYPNTDHCTTASSRKVDEEFGIKLSEKFNENEKWFWKEVNKDRGGVRVST